MKLSPPASSSDLEAARGIARRLARLAHPGEFREAPMPVFAPNAGVRAAEPPRARAAEVPAQLPKAAAPAAPPKAAPARQAPPPVPAPAPEPARAAPARAPEAQPAPKAAAPPPPPPLQAWRPAPPPPPAEEPLGILTEDEPAGLSSREEPLGVVDEPEAPRPVAEMELDSDAGESPFAAASESHEIELADIEGGSKGEPELELVTDFDDEKPAPPSWSDILQDCLFLARARGALLIDPVGKVAASCGEWPPPGVDAIGARLVPAMEKALKNAPARSVSVPLGTLHLTAWRVPLPSGVLTVGFVAEAPLKPEVRPTIDGELKRGEAA